MKWGKFNLKDAIKPYKFDLDLLQKIPCSDKENKEYRKMLQEDGKLPEGVYPYTNAKGKASLKEFYTVYEPDLTEAELEEYLKYKELSILNTIKNLTYTKINLLNIITDCLIFIVLLLIIALILGGLLSFS